MSLPDADTIRADLEAIDRLREAHAAAVNAGDAATLAALFAEDGVLMPPNAPASVGREMIQSWLDAFLDAFRAEFALSATEVQAASDWAFERGGYTISLAPRAGGEPLQETGKYITIYQRQPDGAWETARDIWNSDSPPPGME